MRKNIVVILILFFQTVYSQQEREIFNVGFKGIVLNSKTKSPVPFVNIFIKKKGIYRFCDEKGSFNFNLKVAFSKEDKVTLSSIGYESLVLPLKKLQGVLKLKPSTEELDEVVITSKKKKLSPIQVVKKVISLKKKNYPTKPFNQNRYSNIVLSEEDDIKLDFEFISKEYHQGYTQLDLATRRIEHIRWNKVLKDKSVFNNAGQIYDSRQDPMQYASYLKRNRYKNFDYKFITANDSINQELFIIEFESKKNDWKYTQFDNQFYHNRIRIQAFKGRMYVRKSDFAVVKIVEDWVASSLNEKIDSLWVITKQRYEKNINSFKLRQTETFKYRTVKDDQNYPLSYSQKHYIDYLGIDKKEFRAYYMLTSFFYNTETKKVESFPWEGLDIEKKYSSFNNVNFDEIFWKSFSNLNSKK